MFLRNSYCVLRALNPAANFYTEQLKLRQWSVQLMCRFASPRDPAFTKYWAIFRSSKASPSLSLPRSPSFLSIICSIQNGYFGIQNPGLQWICSEIFAFFWQPSCCCYCRQLRTSWKWPPLHPLLIREGNYEREMVLFCQFHLNSKIITHTYIFILFMMKNTSIDPLTRTCPGSTHKIQSMTRHGLKCMKTNY